MTFHRNCSSAAAIAAPFLFATILPAQGYGPLLATLVPQSNVPGAVSGPGIASRADGSWVLFGGQQAGALLNGTYVQANGIWQPRVSVLNPAVRSGHQFTYDALRGECVMFGGRDQLGNPLADTWVFAGDQWSYRPLAVSPSARQGHRMCFDRSRGVVALFGGEGTQVLLQDTWTWNGAVWTQMSTPTAPAARHDHGLAYDADRQVVVLFGGDAANGLRKDVWEWDGSVWTEKFPAPSNGSPFGPESRSQHAMGFDATAGRVVVFGGDRGASGLAGDVWAFDGNSWMALLAGPTATVPSARAQATFGVGASGRLRAFGGLTAAGPTNEMWEITLPVLPRVAEYGSPCIGGAGPLLLRQVAGTSASIGATLGLRMTGFSSPFALGWGFLGLSDSNAGGVALPADLGVVGIPGCNAYGSADFSFALGLPSGSPLQTNWNLAIPNDSYFLGVQVYLQGVALEAFGFSRFATVTNGVSVRVGSTAGLPYNINLVEAFADEQNMDLSASAGGWSNGARSAQLGGDGRHGPFEIADGTDVGAGVFQWNLDNITISGSRTLTGQSVTVTDGRFFFTDFVVPAGMTLRLVGTSPAQIHVAGRVEILGRVEANGVGQVTFNCRNAQLTLPNNPVPGQLGSLGGPGGGRGGQGGDRCFGTGPLATNNGRNGEDLRLPAGHAYAGAAIGTGGRGSPMHPAHGLDVSLQTPVNTYTSGGVFNSNVGFGGSGGGYGFLGSVASNVPVVPNVVQILPAAPVAGGIVFDPLPIPSASTSSLAHFLIGGAGGGGGGSHPYLGLASNVATFNADRWKAGGGGTGGGGALALRSGRSISVGLTGRIEARGGRGATYNGDNPTTPTQDSVSAATGPHWGIPVPGGGGSGGTILLQAARDITVDGFLDASGGVGSNTDGILPNTLDIDNRGGNGAPGFYRLEALGVVSVTNSGNVPTFNGLRNTGSLRSVDRDDASSSRSIWRTTGLPIAPQWLRYEMQVDINGDGVVDRVYSDDPSVSGTFGPATDPLGPVTIRFQGGRVSAPGVVDPSSVGPWRSFVANQLGTGIQSDSATGFRFHMVFNTQAFPVCVVKRVEVFVRA